MHVRKSIAKEKVAWVYALRIVAAMQHPKPVRNWSAVNLVRRPVSINDALAFAEMNLAIAAHVVGAGPNPALVGAANLRVQIKAAAKAVTGPGSLGWIAIWHL